MHAVILAGGKGTRLRPLTDTRPKPLLPFCGAPFAAGLLRRLAEAGATHATFLVGQDATPFLPLESLGGELGLPVAVVTEPEPLDTAGACRKLLRSSGELALVCNGDILTDLDYGGLVAAHRGAGALVTLALTRVDDTSSFGVIETESSGQIMRFIEKPPAGTVDADTINAGTYVVAPGAFTAFEGDGPLSFERAVFPQLLEAGELLLGVAHEGYWLDLGTPQRYLDGTRAVLEGRCAWPLDDSYVLHDNGVLAHRSAQLQGALGPDVVAGPGVRLGDGVRIAGSVLFEDVQVGAGAVIEGSILAEGAVVDPDAVVTATVTPARTRVADNA